MRRTAAVILALAGLAATVAATPAHADAPTTYGVLCALTPIGGGTYVMTGGPVFLTEADGTTPESGWFVCRAQRGPDHTSSGEQEVQHGTGYFVLGPRLVAFVPVGDVYVCSEFVDASNGVTYYWNADLGVWSTDPLSHCDPAPLT